MENNRPRSTRCEWFGLLPRVWQYFCYMKEDHRSYIRNFCSCEKKAWKRFRLVQDSNPCSKCRITAVKLYQSRKFSITAVKWYQGRKCCITAVKWYQGRKCCITAVKWYQGRKCCITAVEWYRGRKCCITAVEWYQGRKCCITEVNDITMLRDELCENVARLHTCTYFKLR